MKNAPVNISSKVDELSLVKDENPKKEESIREFISKEINSSVIVESADSESEIKKEIYAILVESIPTGNKTGNNIEGFESRIFPLIIDSNLGNPDYLSRKNGIKITILLDNKNRLGNTIWAHEAFATDIIRRIYKSGFGENVGFVSVLFIDATTDEDLILLTLNAADERKYEDKWNDEDSYICSLGWSELLIPKESKIIFYEKNDASLCSSLAYDEKNTESIENDAYFKDYVPKTYTEIAENLNEIDKFSKDGDYKNVIKSAAALNNRLFTIKNELKKISVSKDYKDKKNELMDVIFLISDAMSDYWYFGEYSDSEALLRASEGARKGLEKLNSLAATMNIVPYEVDTVINSNDYHFVDTHSLCDSFFYKDKSGGNDLSFKVEDWTLASGILAKNVLTGEVKQIKADYDEIFLLVTLRFAHLGYRGFGVDGVKTPSLNSFKLYYNGDEYSPFAVTDYMQNVGVPYYSKKLGRMEVFESVLVFPMKKDLYGENFIDKRAFLSLSPEGYDVQTWSLKKEMF